MLLLVAKALGSAHRFLLRLLGLHSLCWSILLQGAFTLLGCESTGRGLIPRASLTAANGVDEGFGVGIMIDLYSQCAEQVQFSKS